MKGTRLSDKTGSVGQSNGIFEIDPRYDAVGSSRVTRRTFLLTFLTGSPLTVALGQISPMERLVKMQTWVNQRRKRTTNSAGREGPAVKEREERLKQNESLEVASQSENGMNKGIRVERIQVAPFMIPHRNHIRRAYCYYFLFRFAVHASRTHRYENDAGRNRT